MAKYQFLNINPLGKLEEFSGMSIDEFSHYHPEGVYLIRIDNHLTCMIDGTILDIWDCTNNEIRLVWKV